LAFAARANNLTLGLDLKAKIIGGDAIWSLIVLEVVIARLGIIAELELVLTGLEA